MKVNNLKKSTQIENINMEATLFESVLCTETTELQLNSLLQVILPLIIKCSVLMLEIRGELRKTVSLFKIECLGNLCIKSILFQAYKEEIWLRLWGATFWVQSVQHKT